MRQLIWLLIFLTACGGPVIGADIDTPVPSEATPQVDEGFTKILVEIRAKEACITTLQQYYTDEQWANLDTLTSRYYPETLHLGEAACEQEAYYQTLPLEIQLLMMRIQSSQNVINNYTNSAAPNHEHTCDEYGYTIRCR